MGESNPESKPESKTDEHDRLQRRTDTLADEHESLGLDRRSFDKSEHDSHAADLLEHKDALERHRRRAPDPD